ncbi:4Fe-4S binding protein [Metaclostridioides mangenotii]|uniref:4Fe-4S binding protein n=1 Tax=Metaclostridioides mangenotii TaxID=1540 RepID=UPI0028ECFAC3|nr:4Fe-4S binding protein [Clostridioides mangenotii]
MKNKKNWYDYLWIISALYLILGLFNILFAWLGLLCFFIPLIISIFKGNKAYCNKYCGRGQLFQLLGNKFKLLKDKDIPHFMKSKWFRYSFLVFFLLMFINMLFITVQVFIHASNPKEVITLFWTWKVPWESVFGSLNVPAWITQFAYGFYSMMLTSTLLGLITMFLFKPRSWCVYCPMGTMTQTICKIKNK